MSSSTIYILSVTLRATGQVPIATCELQTTDHLHASRAYTAALESLFQNLHELTQTLLTPADLAAYQARHAASVADLTALLQASRQASQQAITGDNP